MDDDATDEAGAPHSAEPLTAAADPGSAHDRAAALKDRYLGGGSDPAPLDAAIELELQVVATLWPVHDAPAARLTRDVHTALAACTGLPAPPPAARILNAAARRLRDGRPDHPAFWAGHIHTGR